MGIIGYAILAILFGIVVALILSQCKKRCEHQDKDGNHDKGERVPDIIVHVDPEESIEVKVNMDFETAFDAYSDGHKSAVLINELRRLEYLPNVDGFEAVITLLKHRHRKRSLARLEELWNDWKLQGLELYRT